jgi:alcohol dehydrogenase
MHQKGFGASDFINNSREDAVAAVKQLTDGLGADVAIEAVGIPETFELCAELIRPGGRLANVGVHGKPATLHLEDLWIKGVEIRTGLVDTYSTATLLKLVASRQLELDRFITHNFPMDQFMEAYDTFARAGETGALKVVLTRA